MQVDLSPDPPQWMHPHLVWENRVGPAVRYKSNMHSSWFIIRLFPAAFRVMLASEILALLRPPVQAEEVPQPDSRNSPRRRLRAPPGTPGAELLTCRSSPMSSMGAPFW